MRNELRKALIGALALFLLSVPGLSAQQADTLEVSSKVSTFLRFPADVKFAEMSDGNEYIGYANAGGSLNIIRMQAIKPFTQVFNFTAIDANGGFHHFFIRYTDTPRTTSYDISDNAYAMKDVARSGGSTGAGKHSSYSVDQILEMPQTLYHLAGKTGKITLVVENIFSMNDRFYITLRLENGSGISFETSNRPTSAVTMILLTYDGKGRARKTPKTAETIDIIGASGTLTTPSRSSSRATYEFAKKHVSATDVLEISVPEPQTNRVVKLTLSPEDINNAIHPDEISTRRRK